MFSKLTPNLMVADVNLAVTFYRDILGFYATEEFYIQDLNGYFLGFATRLGEPSP
jgi:catechol 2,3-dioxygenase-like lactoylglutathione lyase family enzyme